MPGSDFEARLAALAGRIERIERRLGILGDADRAASPRSPAAAPSAPTAPPVAKPPDRDTGAVPPAIPRTPKRAGAREEGASHRRPVFASVRRFVLGEEEGPLKDRLERLVGGRWYVVVGTLVIVIGVSLALKLAIDRGWLGAIPPDVRCAIAALFGFALLGAGEWVLRRWGSAASIGPSAAGIGTIYAAAYAAYAMEVIAKPAAFVLLVLSALVGIVVGIRARLLSVSVLALAGAYLAPILLHEGPSPPAVLPAYLLSVLAVGLVLSAVMGGRFQALRRIVWWGTVLYGTFWGLTEAQDHPWIALPFFALAWAMIHAELVWSAMQGDRRWERYKALPRRVPLGMASSFSVSAWSTAFGAVTLAPTGLEWMSPGAGVVVAGWAALILGGHLRVLRDAPRSNTERLGAALLMQAGALLIAAVALGLGNWLEVAAWLGLGVAAAGAGRWLESPGLKVYGLIVLVIGAARLVLLEWWTTAVAAAGVEFIGFYLTRWMVLVLIGAAAWVATAFLIRADGVWRWISNGCIGIGLTLGAMSLVHESASGSSVAGVAPVLGLVSAAWGRRVRSHGLESYAVCALAFAMIVFLGARWWEHWGPGLSIAGLFWLTWWTIPVLIACVCWAGVGLIIDEREGWRAVGGACAAAALACLLGALVHARADGTAVSVAWLVISLIVMAARGWRPRLMLDRVGLGGAGAAGLAWVVVYVVRGWDRFDVAVHPGLVMAFVFAAAAFWLIPILGCAKWPRVVWIVRAIGVAFVFTATSFEVARLAEHVATDPTAHRSAVSIWWGVFAVGLIAAGFWRGEALARRVGLALLGVATAKAAFVDLADVPAGWRVVSFVGLGVLMLGVGVAYARLSAMLTQEESSGSGVRADHRSPADG